MHDMYTPMIEVNWSPPLGICSLSSPNLWFAKGTGTDSLVGVEWKRREDDTLLILFAQNLSIMPMLTALPFSSPFLYHQEIRSLASTMLGIPGPCISLFGYGTKSHTQTKWLTTELIGGDITTRQNHEPSSPPSAPGGGGASDKSSRIPINYMLPVPHSMLLPPNAKRAVRSCWTSLQEWMWVWDYRYVVVLVIPLQAFCWLWLPVACDVIVIW